MRQREAPAARPKQAAAARGPQAPARSRPGRIPPGRIAAQLAAQQRPAREERAVRAEPSRNRTGLPDRLKAGIEALSGFSMDDVTVHYASSKPAQLRALAYTQGTDIHVGPGQEKHLAHEAWHVVQQKQGRVRATRQLKGVEVNDDPGLEAEADRMGARAAEGGRAARGATPREVSPGQAPVQRRAGIEYETMIPARRLPPVPGPNDLPIPPNDDRLWVTQDEVMAQGPGWHVVSDNSKLEFVTDPPVAVQALRNVVGNMVGVLSRIPAPLNAATGFQAHIGIAPARGYNILPYQNPMITGKMQGTIGVDYAKLPAFFTLVAAHDLGAANTRYRTHRRVVPARTQQQRDHLENLRTDTKALSQADQGDVTNVIGVVDQLTTPLRNLANLNPVPAAKANQIEQHEKLRGLLMFVGQYIVFSGQYVRSYAKKSFPIMARTAFTSMYKALPRRMKHEFLPLARQLVVALNRQLNDVAFGQHANQLHASARFTLGEWLNSIVTANQAVSDLMTAPGAALHPTDASMGSMGMDQGKVVLELRGLSGNHPPQSVRAFVEDLIRLDAEPMRP